MPVVKSVAIIAEKNSFVFGPDRQMKDDVISPDSIHSDADIFAYPVKNFGRFPLHVKAACCACAMALKAAGIGYGREKKLYIALLTAGYAPTLEVNHAFFQDYIDNGRTLGRGNLFIYSLPTSALAEVSIHFGLTGPGLFIDSEHAPLKEMLVSAEQIMKESGTSNTVVFWQDKHNVLCLVIGAENSREDHIADFTDIKNQSAGWRNPGKALRYFETNAVKPRNQ